MTTAVMMIPPDLRLSYGSHTGPGDDAVCLVEASVVHVLRKRKADTDPTICPVVRKMAAGLNDAYPRGAVGDHARTAELRRFVPLLPHTRSTKKAERRRSYLAVDWLIRVFAPAWLRLVPELVVHADALAGLPEIVDGDAGAAREVSAVQAAIQAAVREVYAGVTCCGGASNDAAAWETVRAAAWWAGRAAAQATPGAVLDAAQGATETAYCSTVAAAWLTRTALEPTAITLRRSAIQLLDRMIAVTPHQVTT